MYIRKFT